MSLPRLQILAKTCHKCKVEKPLEEFARCGKSKDGLHIQCRACFKEYYKANRQRIIATALDHYYTHRAERLERMRKFRENPDDVDVGAVISYRAKYMAHNLWDRARKFGRYRDKRLNTKFISQMLINNPNCNCCGKALCFTYSRKSRLEPDSPTIDRVNNSRGYTLDNVAIICHRCNSIKNNRSASDLLESAKALDSGTARKNVTSTASELRQMANWMRGRGVI